MNIKVRNIISEHNVCVIVDGYCNHFDSIVELLDAGYASRALGDWIEDWRDTTVCARCGAIFNEAERTWEEIR